MTPLAEQLAASITVFSKASKPNNFLISEPIVVIFHQTTRLNWLIICKQIHLSQRTTKPTLRPV